MTAKQQKNISMKRYVRTNVLINLNNKHMKQYITICALSLIMCACNNSKKVQKMPSAYYGIVKKSNKHLLDSLLLLQTSYDSLWILHKKNLRAAAGKYYDYHYSIFETPNKKNIAYATSDNVKFKKLLTQLPKISPVDFIVELSTFRGNVRAQSDWFYYDTAFVAVPPTFPENWVNRGNLGTLLALSKVAAPSAYFSVNSCFIPIDSHTKELRVAKLVGVVGFNAEEIIRIYYLLKLKLKLPDPSNGRRSNILPLVEEWYKSGEPESALQSYIDKYKASN